MWVWLVCLLLPPGGRVCNCHGSSIEFKETNYKTYVKFKKMKQYLTVVFKMLLQLYMLILFHSQLSTCADMNFCKFLKHLQLSYTRLCWREKTINWIDVFFSHSCSMSWTQQRPHEWLWILAKLLLSGRLLQFRLKWCKLSYTWKFCPSCCCTGTAESLQTSLDQILQYILHCF